MTPRMPAGPGQAIGHTVPRIVRGITGVKKVPSRARPAGLGRCPAVGLEANDRRYAPASENE